MWNNSHRTSLNIASSFLDKQNLFLQKDFVFFSKFTVGRHKADITDIQKLACTEIIYVHHKQVFMSVILLMSTYIFIYNDS